MSTKASFKKANPYLDDAMNLPVEDLDQAITFYETVMGFKLGSEARHPSQVRSVIKRRGSNWFSGEWRRSLE